MIALDDFTDENLETLYVLLDQFTGGWVKTMAADELDRRRLARERVEYEERKANRDRGR